MLTNAAYSNGWNTLHIINRQILEELARQLEVFGLDDDSLGWSLLDRMMGIVKRYKSGGILKPLR
jgi:hypothetical protein